MVALPPASFWKNQPAYEIAFGNAWRIVLASMIAYFCGEFVNSFVLAKMKVLQNGKHLWMRTIGSTICGEAVDSTLFYPLAFYNTGIIPNEALPAVMFAQFVTKTLVEIVFTPLTYKVVGALKRAEQEDVYDRKHRLQPLQGVGRVCRHPPSSPHAASRRRARCGTQRQERRSPRTRF